MLIESLSFVFDDLFDVCLSAVVELHFFDAIVGVQVVLVVFGEVLVEGFELLSIFFEVD